MMAALDLEKAEASEVFENIEIRISELMQGWLEAADPELPVILTAHASVQGASYGSERTVMLGADLVLPGSLVKDERLDYVALGHIHKPQNLNGPGPDPGDKTKEFTSPGDLSRLDRAR